MLLLVRIRLTLRGIYLYLYGAPLRTLLVDNFLPESRLTNSIEVVIGYNTAPHGNHGNTMSSASLCSKGKGYVVPIEDESVVEQRQPDLSHIGPVTARLRESIRCQMQLKTEVEARRARQELKRRMLERMKVLKGIEVSHAPRPWDEDKDPINALLDAMLEGPGRSYLCAARSSR